MSGGVFDWQQYSIQEIISILDELTEEYENVTGVDDKIRISNSRIYIDDLSDELVEEMKQLKDRLKRDFLWVDTMDKYLSGDLSEKNYYKKLEIIRFDNVDDYVWDE
jgi:hypothetical protein